VHLSELGHCILGDPVYRRGLRKLSHGLNTALAPVNHQLLHAAHLAFDHPITGERLSFDVDVPADFQTVAKAAGLEIL
jgi:23S rRNA pseudouridine1911/1915/1917 synthase